MALSIGLIVRPLAGAEELGFLRKSVEELRERGHRVTPRLTFEAGDGTRLARAAAGGRYDLVVAVGGDGTVNEVVNGLVRSPWQPRLGIVPMGTANDFAAGLDLPSDPGEALRVAVHGHPTAVDVAHANDRRFINVSTGGFGAEASEDAPPEAKRRLGTWAYVITGVRKFAELRPTRARFLAGEQVVFEGRFLLFAVGNARRTGGGSRLTPRAEFGDGLLDLLVVPEMPTMEFIALLPDLRRGTHVNRPEVIYEQAPGFRVEAERTLSVNVDGEPLRAKRIDYGLAERPLSVMAP
ncbi:MAG: diacylglycerol/lipid kinase family protein [Gemmatimonadota bacterium]